MEAEKNYGSGNSDAHTIHFLTQDELWQLFKVIRSKRDKAIFLVAYRTGCERLRWDCCSELMWMRSRGGSAFTD